MAKTVFVDGDPVNKLPGTRLMAAFLNLVFNHRHDGGNADGSAPLDFAVDTGAVNAIVVALTPAITALTVGMPIGIQVAATNTDAVTVEVNGLGPYPLHKLGGEALIAADIHATQIIQVAWDGTNLQLLTYNPPPFTDATTLQGQGAAMLAPPGIKGEFFMPTAPAGWLPCDGRALLRSQYPALFAAIGTTWGAGDNVSTFNLPEVRGEFFRAWDNGRGVDGGRQFGSWQDGDLESHNHTLPQGSGVLGGVTTDHGIDATLTNTLIVTNPTGGTETRPRNIALLVCIKY